MRIEDIERLIRPETWLISVMLANNETGTVQPVKEIAEMAAGSGILMHTDAVQAVGKMEVDAVELGADLLTLSAHKFYGPKGVGGLSIRSGFKLRPLTFGGAQEGGYSAGTENVPAIVGFGKAAELARTELASRTARLNALRQRLLCGLREQVTEMAVKSPAEACLPNTLNVSFPGCANAALAARLNQAGIAVGLGSACRTGEPSHVLRAMGKTPAEVAGALRLSWSPFHSEADIDVLVATLAEAVVQSHGEVVK